MCDDLAYGDLQMGWSILFEEGATFAVEIGLPQDTR